VRHPQTARDKFRDITHRSAKVLVRVRCARCERVVGECLGLNQAHLWGVWSNSDEVDSRAVWAANYRDDPDARMFCSRLRFRCPCGADHQVRSDRLAAAFGIAAKAPTKRERVIRLPIDLHA
jgi:hypothetical protein